MVLARLVSFALVVVFAWAAAAKVARPRRWAVTLSRYRLPGRLRRPSVVAVPLVEAGVAALLLLERTRPAGAIVLALTASFSLVILRAHVLLGQRLPCGCFGSTRDRDYRILLARNVALALAAAGLLLYGRDVPGYPPVPSSDAWIAALLVVVGCALVIWLFASVRSGIRRGTT